MKPYAFDPLRKNDVGCCPGHDWPVLYRYAGKYSSTHAKRSAGEDNRVAKRSRRRMDKQRLKEERYEDCIRDEA